MLSILAASSSQSSSSFGPIVMMIFFLAIGLVVLAFWIWMLVDCIKNEPSEGNDKVVWVLVIALAGWLGALIYLFARRPARIRQFGR